MKRKGNKNILVKCCKDSSFLRTEALSKAIEFEEKYLRGEINKYDSFHWIKKGTVDSYKIEAYNSKDCIVVSVEKITPVELKIKMK